MCTALLLLELRVGLVDMVCVHVNHTGCMVRRATGLGLQIGGVCRLEWRRLEVAELLLAAE